MRNVIVAILLVGLISCMAVATIPGWNRSELIQFIRDEMTPLEHLLKPGDVFDYDHLIFGSCYLNDTWEEVVCVPLTNESTSYKEAIALGDQYLWSEVAPLMLYGFYVLPPVEAFHSFEANTPYLARASGWGEAEYVDQNGAFVRTLQITWARPTGSYAYVTMMPHGGMSNIVFHMTTSGCATTNQN